LTYKLNHAITLLYQRIALEEILMVKFIEYEQWRRMLQAAAEEIDHNKNYLSKLDEIIGDGDHGTTISKAMAIITDTLALGPVDDLKALLNNISRALLGLAGGATGPLLGSMFKGLSDGMEVGEKIDASVLSRMFETSEKAVLKVSGAAVGDKTMIDAFVPAVAGIVREAASGDIGKMLEEGMRAAEAGAESTKSLIAKKGRAKNMGEKSIGLLDAGSMSISFLFKGFYKGIQV
jgi:phosphoenolpyruvate---glycerone phosphotransferase subunit DhaL